MLLTAKNKIGRPELSIHKCNCCGYETKKTSALDKHYLDMHASEDERVAGYKHYCKHCKVGFMGISGYNIHKDSKKHARMIADVTN